MQPLWARTGEEQARRPPVLEGRQATTNWFFAGVLVPLGATYHRQRWVQDGNVTMSAACPPGSTGRCTWSPG